MTLKISEAFEVYRGEVIVFRNQSRKTEEMHQLVLKSLLSQYGDIAVTMLTFQQIRDWKEYLEKTRSQNTARGYVIKLRVVLAHMRSMGLDVISPERIGIPKRKTMLVDFITQDEVTSLIDACGKAHSGYARVKRYKNMAIVSLLYASGIRVSELTQLNRSSIRDDGTFTIIGKGDKARLCFTDDRTTSYLKQYLALRTDTNPALFISDLTGERLSVAIVQMMMRNASKKAGFNRTIHPHTLRHSFATNLLRNNTNIVYVKDFLGHSSIQTTAMYMHFTNPDLMKIYKEKHTI